MCFHARRVLLWCRSGRAEELVTAWGQVRHAATPVVLAMARGISRRVIGSGIQSVLPDWADPSAHRVPSGLQDVSEPCPVLR